MRALASIQRVKFLNTIPKADRIELATINGWQAIVKKGEFSKGDLVVLFEIDSFISENDKRFASFQDKFSNWEGKRGLRVRTIKLRGEISQGIIMRVSDFQELDGLDISEGFDVTELLGVEKWEFKEKYPSGQVQRTGNFPSFIRKTDQERVQNIVSHLPNYLGVIFEVTIKKDGSSMTVFKVMPSSPYYSVIAKAGDEGPIYGICSRNVWLKLDGDSNFHIAAAPILEALKGVHSSVAIQAEVVAPSIQGNYEEVTDVEYHIFDVFDIDQQAYFPAVARDIFCHYGRLKQVTMVAMEKLSAFLGGTEFTDEYEILKAILAKASGPSDNPSVMREGIVFKSSDGKFSFKAVSNEYLLSSGK